MNKKPSEISINTDYITLGQFLKYVDIISCGSEAKWFLAENDVLINDELDNRRGRKLRDGDVVEISNKVYKIVKKWL